MATDATPEAYGREAHELPRAVTPTDLQVYLRKDRSQTERIVRGMPVQARVERYMFDRQPCIVVRLLNGMHPKIAAQTIPLTVLQAEQLIEDLQAAIKPFLSHDDSLDIEDDGRDNWTDGEVLPVNQEPPRRP